MLPFTVAIIDDETQLRITTKRLLKLAYGEAVTVFEGSTVSDGEMLLKLHHPDVFLIDGQLESRVWDSGQLISAILEERKANPAYSCSIIAFSSNEDINQQMVGAGCDRSIHKLGSYRSRLQATIDEVRGL